MTARIRGDKKRARNVRCRTRRSRGPMLLDEGSTHSETKTRRATTGGTTRLTRSRRVRVAVCAARVSERYSHLPERTPAFSASWRSSEWSSRNSFNGSGATWSKCRSSCLSSSESSARSSGVMTPSISKSTRAQRRRFFSGVHSLDGAPFEGWRTAKTRANGFSFRRMGMPSRVLPERRYCSTISGGLLGSAAIVDIRFLG